MKKIFVILACVAGLCSCTQNPGIQWNVTADVQGNGKVVVSYPTGQMTAEGDAVISAMSVMDTVAVEAPNFQAVLASPEEYSEEQVKLAEEVNSAFNVEVLEGDWKASIKGYAKYGKIYVVIDESWPKDTTMVAEPVEAVVE